MTVMGKAWRQKWKWNSWNLLATYLESSNLQNGLVTVMGKAWRQKWKCMKLFLKKTSHSLTYLESSNLSFKPFTSCWSVPIVCCKELIGILDSVSFRVIYSLHKQLKDRESRNVLPYLVQRG